MIQETPWHCISLPHIASVSSKRVTGKRCTRVLAVQQLSVEPSFALKRLPDDHLK